MLKIITIIILFTAVRINAQQWKIIEEADMPLPVSGGKAVVVDSLIYVLGGFSDSLNANVKVIQEFNPQNNTWRIIDSLNVSRYGPVAFNYNDSIFVMGGVTLNLSLDSSLELWKPGSLSHILSLKPDFIRTFATGLIHNDTFYVFGGISVSLLSTYMFAYSISDSTFTVRENFGFLSGYPFQQMSASIGSSIFLFGGVFIGSSRVIYKYDIINRTHNLLQFELTQARAGGSAVRFNDSLIYLIGGFNESSSSLASVEIFKVVDGNYSSSSGPPLNFERSELTAVKYKNTIYAFGGKDDSGESVRQVEKLDLITNIIDEPQTKPDNFILYPNYPNPFNPSTNISFYLPSRSFVNLKVYNIAGEEIAELINEEMDRGMHEVLFSSGNRYEALNHKIDNLSSGIYIYKLTAFNFSNQNTYISTRKMMLLK